MIRYRFCPQCATPLDLSGVHPTCPSCGAIHYVNPKPTVGVLPQQDGRVLLARRARDPFKGALDIIGGFIEIGESPEEAALREVTEETGLQVQLIDLLGIYLDTYGRDGDHTLNIFYVAEVVGGNLMAQDDVASLHWLELKTLRSVGGFRSTKQALRDLKVWNRRRGIHTEV